VTSPGRLRRRSERIAGEGEERAMVARADVRVLPIDDGAIDIITAHGLFNVLPPSSLPKVVPPWVTGGIAA